MDVVGYLGVSLAAVLVAIVGLVRARHARTVRAQLESESAPPPSTPPRRQATLPGIGPELERIQAHVSRAIQRTGPVPSMPTRQPHTPAFGLASRIASKLTEDLVVDATDDDLSGVASQLDELSDDSLLEISRLLKIDPPTQNVETRPDFDDEADTVLQQPRPALKRPSSIRRFGTPTPTPTPV